MVKLFLDEAHTGLKQYLEILGYEVETVLDVNLKGAEDKRVVEYARDHALVLVTSDQKQAEFSELAGVECVLVYPKVLIAMDVDKRLKRRKEVEG